MVSRAIRLAALSVVLALGAWAAFAQNLDAGKTPGPDVRLHLHGLSNSPRGLVKSCQPGPAPGISPPALHQRPGDGGPARDPCDAERRHAACRDAAADQGAEGRQEGTAGSSPRRPLRARASCRRRPGFAGRC